MFSTSTWSNGIQLIIRYSIIAFVNKGLDRETRRRNFVVILDWLKGLSDKQETPLHESCILTLCRLAKYDYIDPLQSKPAVD